MADRPYIYPGEQARSADFLLGVQNGNVVAGALATLMVGSSTFVGGLACFPTAPASMDVVVGPGCIVTQSTVEPNGAYGSLGVNTQPCMRVGTIGTSTTFALTAPTTPGYSQEYLICAVFEESDGDAVILPYVNATTPSAPFSGPGNAGTAQNTERSAIVGLQLVAGTPAPAGTQTAPATPSGWSPLYIITLNYGATTIIAGNIATASGAPFVGGGSFSHGRVLGLAINSPKVISASETYFPPANLLSAIIETVGGGGGGGGATGGSGTGSSGGGGGGGGYAKAVVTAAQIGASQVISIGAGGSPGAPGSTNFGGSGGTTSFGGYVVSNGGGGGAGAGATASVLSGGGGGAGGTSGGTEATLIIQGKQGTAGLTLGTSGVGIGGAGGDSLLGFGGPQGYPSASTGNTGQAAGGGGGGMGASASSGNGGGGAPGLCIVTEYVLILT